MNDTEGTRQINLITSGNDKPYLLITDGSNKFGGATV